MKNDLLCYGATVPGHKHIKELRNNQDGYYITRFENCIIGVVTDGCTTNSMVSHNDVGANLFAAIIAKTIARRVMDKEEYIDSPRFWELVSQDTLAQIKIIADMLPGKTTLTVKEYLLFTIVGFMVIEDMVIIFHCGDGVYGVNDDIYPIKPAITDEQPYLSYQLTSVNNTGLLPDCRIKVLTLVPLDQVNNLIIATDGLNEIIQLEDKIIPMTKTPGGKLADFWTDEKILKNPHIAQNKLLAMNKKSFTVNYDKREVLHHHELMEDDTTFIVLTKKIVNNDLL